MPPAPSYVIFDLDGTLVDSSPGILHCFTRTLNDYDREADHTLLRQLIGPPLRESFARLGFAEEQLNDVVARYRTYYATSGVTNATLYDGVRDTLGQLHAEGVRLAVATAKRIDFAREMLTHFDLAHYCDVISGASLDLTVTSKFDIMDVVLEEWGRPHGESVWMVGDRAYDMLAAGAHHVQGVGALWGFGSRDELMDAGASWCCATPRELLRGAPE